MDIYAISARVESLTVPTMGIIRKLIPIAFKIFDQMKTAKQDNLAQCESLITKAIDENSLTVEQEKIVRDTLAAFVKPKGANPLDAVQELSTKISADKINKFLELHLKRSIATALKGIAEISRDLKQQNSTIEDEYTQHLWVDSQTKLRVKQDQLFKTMRANNLTIPKTFLDPIDSTTPINTVLDYYITALQSYTKDADKGLLAYVPLALESLQGLKKQVVIEKQMKLGGKDIVISIPKVNPASFVDENILNNVLGILNNKDVDQVRAYRDEAFSVVKSTLESSNGLSVIEGAKVKHLNALVQEADMILLLNDTL